MEKEMYNVQIGDEIRQYESGTTYRQIAEEWQEQYENDIVLVFVNGRLQELFKTLKEDCIIRFETTGDPIGHKTYKRSMSLMLVKAIYDVAEVDTIKKVRIHYSVSKGYYCTIEGNVNLNQEFLARV